MNRMSKAMIAAAVICAPFAAHAEIVTSTVGGHSLTYEATPQAPAVDDSHDHVMALVNQSRPAKATAPVAPPVLPQANAPTLK